MKNYWPRRSGGLPPGQRLLNEMPRFTDNPFAAPPQPLPDLGLTISIEGAEVAHLDANHFQSLGPRAFEAEFHCVTTWSVTDLTWTGVPLCEVLTSLGLDPEPARYMVARSHDRRRGHFLTTDALAEDVIVATHLNGDPLQARHGGPLRLVAPQHYAYKSIKHLVGIDFTSAAPTTLGKEHLRARVALEERHPRLSSRLLRVPYRLLIVPTAYIAERSLQRHQSQTTDETTAPAKPCAPSADSIATPRTEP